MERKTPILLILTSLLSSLGAAQMNNRPGGVGDVFAGGFEFIAEMLMIPVSGDPGGIAIWLGGIGITVLGFKMAVENFDSAVGNWINDDRMYWMLGILLTLIFIGGTNFLGFIRNIVWILVIGVVLFIIGLFIRVVWFGGSFVGGGILWAGHEARTGAIGNAVRGGIDWAEANNVWKFGGGGKIDTAWNDYKNIAKCPNNHLNPGKTTGATPPDHCWVCGDPL